MSIAELAAALGQYSKALLPLPQDLSTLYLPCNQILKNITLHFRMNFFAALSAAKDAGPRPAHIKPLKRMALEIAAKNTFRGNCGR